MKDEASGGLIICAACGVYSEQRQLVAFHARLLSSITSETGKRAPSLQKARRVLIGPVIVCTRQQVVFKKRRRVHSGLRGVMPKPDDHEDCGCSRQSERTSECLTNFFSCWGVITIVEEYGVLVPNGTLDQK